ncbi:MAG: serine--tRNA ligase [Bacteroidales bacterium]|nr:serine--tRNA ligase [Bacteroidales bacterium]MCF8327093.1 serine--tRNA ligase [Bacteroidales bacterium]
MLQIQYLRDHKDEIIKRLAVKNFKDTAIIDQVLELDQQRRETQRQLDDTLAESKKSAKAIGQLMKENKKDEADKAKEKTTELKQKSKELQERLNDITNKQQKLLLDIPNVPHESVPAGNSEDDNILIKEDGTKPEVSKDHLPHWELAKKFNLIDFDQGVKITGAGFPVYKNKGARLQRALQSFFLDSALEAGYDEVQPPLLVNEASGYGTGQLPDKDGQMYHIPADNFYLIPTAEVPITNLYRDMIVDEKDLPLKNSAYSACFRREAGSYGKDVRGLNRLHQFDKVEIVQVVHPGKSYETLEGMLNYIISLVEKLELPYRVLKLCGGDTSFAAALTYDVEVFSAAQNRWLEVSSVSNFEAFQANRMKLRIKTEDGKKQPAHTLNGSALAFPRILAALLENNQQAGKIKVPRVLVNYTNFEYID